MTRLRTQIISETNSAFLCHGKSVTVAMVESIQYVIDYKNLEGTATITGINNVDVSWYVNYQHLCIILNHSG